MLCPVCHGRRFIAGVKDCRPCPECGGFGDVHCCDGLQTQPGSTGSNSAPPSPSAITTARTDRAYRHESNE